MTKGKSMKSDKYIQLENISLKTNGIETLEITKKVKNNAIEVYITVTYSHLENYLKNINKVSVLSPEMIASLSAEQIEAFSKYQKNIANLFSSQNVEKEDVYKLREFKFKDNEMSSSNIEKEKFHIEGAESIISSLENISSHLKGKGFRYIEETGLSDKGEELLESTIKKYEKQYSGSIYKDSKLFLPLQASDLSNTSMSFLKDKHSKATEFLLVIFSNSHRGIFSIRKTKPKDKKESHQLLDTFLIDLKNDLLEAKENINQDKKKKSQKKEISANKEEAEMEVEKYIEQIKAKIGNTLRIS